MRCARIFRVLAGGDQALVPRPGRPLKEMTVLELALLLSEVGWVFSVRPRRRLDGGPQPVNYELGGETLVGNDGASSPAPAVHALPP